MEKKQVPFGFPVSLFCDGKQRLQAMGVLCTVCDNVCCNCLTWEQCGHSVCANCVPSSPPCPLCKTVQTLRPNVAMRRLIDSLPVQCKNLADCCYTMDASFRPWKGPLAELSNHLTTSCGAEPTQCPHCNAKMKRRVQEEHVPQCFSRPVACKYCQCAMMLRDVPEHEANLCLRRPNRPIDCPLCKSSKQEDSKADEKKADKPLTYGDWHSHLMDPLCVRQHILALLPEPSAAHDPDVLLQPKNGQHPGTYRRLADLQPVDALHGTLLMDQTYADVRSTQDDKWYVAKVHNYSKSEFHWFVEFLGFSSQHNEVIEKRANGRFAPVNTRASLGSNKQNGATAFNCPVNDFVRGRWTCCGEENVYAPHVDKPLLVAKELLQPVANKKN